MKYIIDDIEFDLSRPITKYWYSTIKKSLLKNNIGFIRDVLADAKNKNKIKYSSKVF